MRQQEGGSLFEADGVYLARKKCLKVGTVDEVLEADGKFRLYFFLRNSLVSFEDCHETKPYCIT